MHLALSRRYSKGLDILSRLGRTPADKSDEPAGVIEIYTIDNIYTLCIEYMREGMGKGMRKV